MILNVDKVTKSFGTRVLFSNVSFRINERDRYALVGPNGAGKTTLMNIIAGLESADEGQVVFSRDAHPGYLEQESIEMEGRSVLEEVMTSVADVAEMGRRLEALEREMESADESRADGLLAEYGRLRTRFEARDGYNIESQARRVLFGLGFHEEDMERSTDEFSGGWQMRIALSKLLLRAPEILLLDEPTNHLDLESVRWLENFLKSYRGAVLVVSHDRAFMNGMVDHVARDSQRQARHLHGQLRCLSRPARRGACRLLAMKEAQDREIAHMEAFVEKFRYKATKAKQVQDRVKKLERIERIRDSPRRRRNCISPFPSPRARVITSCTSKGVSKSFGEKRVYENLDLDIWRGDKIALVGPNGSGKSTLLKMIAGELSHEAVRSTTAAHVELSYFAQHQLEELNLRKF